MAERVVITGLGAVTPLGNSAPQFWAGLVEGRSGIGGITRFDSSVLDTHFAGELKEFDPAQTMD
ncbi:MAG: beta-ketoacyl-[acyl-carrier-protein] synthase II, partial [Candidatus Eisenbacteria bacterium]|nr:beta-ketoacyl-[acyl-carrier-protein] synthase II [Candidatus Eisenbacteria bacterium]